ncbi:muscarinic acetylcholine receptor M3 isoform X1 [Hydra vulgaris]|uniref:MAch receptor 2 n=1 Tax=Hydra vulgaris TaxID=6087 RepID=A0A1B0NMK0_HYDVU|nr:muscarinic acetylcholine receptor M3-like [Hydra vulgaris]AGG14162.1 mAch receptor 2 [Hydra vulgaris]
MLKMLVKNVANNSKLLNSRFSNTELGFVVFGLTLISFIATTANICVFIAYIKNQSLRTASNWLILSLAVADTWISAISINFYTVYLVYGYWPLGKIACKFWLSTDYWCSQASVAHLIVISVDRYFLIRVPLIYRPVRNLRLKYVIFFVWFLSFVLWVPWIISYQYIVSKQDVPVDKCYIQFLTDSVFLTIFTSLSAYYVPLLTMFYMYIRMYTFLQKRKRTVDRVKAPNYFSDLTVTSVSCDSVTQSNTCLEVDSTANNKVLSQACQTLPKIKYKNYDRIKKLLILIILAYAITWLPFNAFSVISTFCNTCVTAPLWNFGFLFCYINSLVNPFCYALGNKRFKAAFKSMFIFKEINKNPNK